MKKKYLKNYIFSKNVLKNKYFKDFFFMKYLIFFLQDFKHILKLILSETPW